MNYDQSSGTPLPAPGITILVQKLLEGQRRVARHLSEVGVHQKATGRLGVGCEERAGSRRVPLVRRCSEDLRACAVFFDLCDTTTRHLVVRARSVMC